MVRSACSPARTGQLHRLAKIATSQSWRKPAMSSPFGRCFTTAAARRVRSRTSTAASSTWNSPAAGSCRTDTNGSILSGQYLADEFLSARGLGMIDDFFRGPFLGDFSFGKQKDPIGAPAGKEDFMRDHDEG